MFQRGDWVKVTCPSPYNSEWEGIEVCIVGISWAHGYPSYHGRNAEERPNQLIYMVLGEFSKI